MDLVNSMIMSFEVKKIETVNVNPKNISSHFIFTFV